MSEEQLTALLAKLKDDAGLQEKLKGAADLDAVLAIAKEAGFDISKAAWLRYQANQTLELSDEELEGVAGGAMRNLDKELDTRGFWRAGRAFGEDEVRVF
jgi:predicted ribosomally synthesized peptide with nif11-like leader